MARRVTEPVVQMQAIAHQMSEGDFTVRAPIRSPDEIGALGRALNGLAARLREKVHDLGHEQAKATAILDGMIEGVIAVDGRDVILLLNERARSMFGLDGRAARVSLSSKSSGTRSCTRRFAKAARPARAASRIARSGS